MTDLIKFYVGFSGQDEDNMNPVMAAMDRAECLARTADVALTFSLPGDFKMAVQEQEGTQEEYDQSEEAFVSVLAKYKLKLGVVEDEEVTEEIQRVAEVVIKEADEKRKASLQ